MQQTLLAAVAATAVLNGCAWSPEQSVSFEPPAAYAAVYELATHCAGGRSDFERIEWAWVQGENYPCPSVSGLCNAYWNTNHQIYIASGDLDDLRVIHHELLHDIINSGEHPAAPFSRPCAQHPVGIDLSGEPARILEPEPIN
jgi:hypothetical protein